MTLDQPIICEKPGFMLLGRVDFFEWYTVTFKQREGLMEIELNMSAVPKNN